MELWRCINVMFYEIHVSISANLRISSISIYKIIDLTDFGKSQLIHEIFDNNEWK